MCIWLFVMVCFLKTVVVHVQTWPCSWLGCGHARWFIGVLVSGAATGRQGWAARRANWGLWVAGAQLSESVLWCGPMMGSLGTAGAMDGSEPPTCAYPRRSPRRVARGSVPASGDVARPGVRPSRRSTLQGLTRSTPFLTVAPRTSEARTRPGGFRVSSWEGRVRLATLAVASVVGEEMDPAHRTAPRKGSLAPRPYLRASEIGFCRVEYE